MKKKLKKYIKIVVSLFLAMLVLTACSEEKSYNSADYDKTGNYKPVEEMTQNEIRNELEGMLEDALGE